MQLKHLRCLIFLAACIPAISQVTTITATITDSDGFVWSNAKVNVTFVPNPSFPNINQYNIGSVNLTSNTFIPYLSQNIVSDVNGNISLSVLDNIQIQPAGSTWKFVIQSNTSAPATSYQPIQLFGTTFNLTNYLSINAIAPRFPASPGVYGYGDVELITVPIPGGQYFDTTTLLTRFWNGLGWNNFVSSSSIGSPGSTSNLHLFGTTVIDNLTTPTLSVSLSGSGVPVYVNSNNGSEIWSTIAPTTGCGNVYPNDSIWHNSSGNHTALTLGYVCNGATTAWIGIY